MLLVEDVLLLLTDDVTGKSAVDSTTLDIALAGSVLLELAARGKVDLARPGEAVKAGRVVVRDPSPTGDPLLDNAVARVQAVSARKPDSLLHQFKKGLADEVRRRLAERGILRFDEGRVLGIFPVSRWPAADSSHEEHVRRALHDVLVTGRSATGEEAAIISVLLAVDKLHLVLPDTGLPRSELKHRAKVVADSGFASEAVRKAMEAMNAAVMAAIITAATASAAASSS